jgi:hypothetical protein
MPSWTHDLPAAPTHHGYDLRRTPPDRPIRAIATCDALNVCFTHYWGGRTRPCETPECEACNAMSPKRAHCYLSAMDPATRDHFLFECTAAAALPFSDWIATYGTLRGCLFQASRPKRRRNAKVEILTKPADLSKISLPPAPDIAAAMSVIWQIPGSAIQHNDAIDMIPAMTIASDKVNRMRINEADFQKATSYRRGNGTP